MFDLRLQEMIDNNANMAVPWFLMAAYAYYRQDDPILTDGAFDRLTTFMLNNWDKIEHRHKNFITKGDLEAGTYLGQYPSIIPGALDSLRNPQTQESTDSVLDKQPPKPKKATTPKPKRPANKNTMGAFGNPLFEWED